MLENSYGVANVKEGDVLVATVPAEARDGGDRDQVAAMDMQNRGGILGPGLWWGHGQLNMEYVLSVREESP